MWPTVERALNFVLRWQLGDGTIRWSLDAQGRPESYALLTGSSSIFHSLCCGVALAERLDLARPEWELAAGRLGHAVAHHPGAFAPKNEFAMDWYYPIFSGALRGRAGERRIDDGCERHVMEGLGVRCVSTNDWVTAAETAECVLALDALGLTSRALELFSCTILHRRSDGAYWTGIAYPDGVTFPDKETTSYTAAAVILAADALTSSSGASGIFRHDGLAPPLDLAEPGCPLALARARAPAAIPRAARSMNATLERSQIDLVGRSSSVGGVGKDVVNEEQPADHDLRGPRLVVRPGDVVAVAAVDEQEVERLGEVRGDDRRVSDEADDRQLRAPRRRWCAASAAGC